MSGIKIVMAVSVVLSISLAAAMTTDCETIPKSFGDPSIVSGTYYSCHPRFIWMEKMPNTVTRDKVIGKAQPSQHNESE